MAGWFVRRGEKTIGPISSSQLKEMAKSGKVLPTDHIAQDVVGPWTEARRTSLFVTPSRPPSTTASRTPAPGLISPPGPESQSVQLVPACEPLQDRERLLEGEAEDRRAPALFRTMWSRHQRLFKVVAAASLAIGACAFAYASVPSWEIDSAAISGVMSSVCSVFVFILVVGGLIAGVQMHAARLRAAKEAYQSCLEQLKHDPTNANLRQETLRFGREYAHLVRNKKGVTIFDEVALKNDIDAVCAGGVHIHARTIEQRLAGLSHMRFDGLIDDDEYQRRRQAIIDEI